jgi:hypothetical protein
MVTTTTVYSFQKPDVSGDEDAWGGYLNANIDKYESILTGNTTITSLVITTADINGGTLDNVVIGGSTAAAVTGTTITGTSFVSSGNMTFGDNNKAIFGAGSDLQIWHDATNNSIIRDAGAGDLYIQASTNLRLTNVGGAETYAIFTENGAATLYYDNSAKIATSSSGISVTGTVTADGLTVDGTAVEVASINSTQNGAQINFDSASTSVDWSVGISNSADGDFLIYQSGSGSGDINFYTGGAKRQEINRNGDISFYEDTGTTAKFFWDASAESLGVGTTAPTNTIEIHDADTSNTIGGSTASMHIVNTDTSAYGRTADLNFDVGATTNPLAAVSGVYTLYDGGTEGALVMSTSNSGSLAERLRITSDGNVGIGVTSPSSYNAAANNLVISDGGNAGITIVSPSTDSGSLFFADGTSGTAAYAGFVQYGHAAEKLILGTGGTTKVTIDGNGNVGIGTSAPIYAADIKTSGTNNGQLRVGGGSTSATGLLLEQTNSGTTTANIQNSYYATSASASLSIKSGVLTFHTGTSGLERLRISSDGNVGIGTSSPQYQKFVINTPDENHMRLENGAELAIIRLMDAGILDFWSHGTSNNEITFSQGVGSGSEVMRIDSSGRLLLNTTVEGYTDYADDFTISNTSGRSGMTIRSGATSQGSIFFSDSNANSGADAYAGYVTYHHNDNRLAFGTSGVERMRIDSSGQVMIGTTSASYPFTVQSTGTSTVHVKTTATNGAAQLRLENDAKAYAVGVGSSDQLYIYDNTNGANRIVVDTNGNVGINKSTPSSYQSYRYLDVAGVSSGQGGVIQVMTSGQEARGQWNVDSGGVRLQAVTNHSLIFYTNATERMRILADGNLLVGKTSTGTTNSGAMDFTVGVGTYLGVLNINHSTTNVSGSGFINFSRDTAYIGSISQNGTTGVSYNTSSDHRLKENVVELTGATARLKQLEPKRFNFIADADTTVDGFLAHEVQSVVPEAITGTHNEVDADGNPVYQGIDQSKLVPLLVATIKELEARITALEGE